MIVGNYRRNRIRGNQLKYQLGCVFHKIKTLVETRNERDVAYIANNLPFFLEATFLHFYETKILGYVLGKSSLCLLKCLNKILPGHPHMSDYNDNFSMFDCMLRFMVLADQVQDYHPCQLFKGEQLPLMFEFMTNHTHNRTIKLFFFAIFSSSSGHISSHYTNLILDNLQSSNVIFETLKGGNEIPYFRALNSLFKRVHLETTMSFFNKERCALLVNFVILIKHSYSYLLKNRLRFIFSCENQCRILVYTTALFKIFVEITSSIEREKEDFVIDNFFKVFVEAAKVIKTYEVCFRHLVHKMFIYDFSDNEIKTFFHWLNETMHNLKYAYATMLELHKFSNKVSRASEQESRLLGVFGDTRDEQ